MLNNICSKLIYLENIIWPGINLTVHLFESLGYKAPENYLKRWYRKEEGNNYSVDASYTNERLVRVYVDMWRYVLIMNSLSRLVVFFSAFLVETNHFPLPRYKQPWRVLIS